MVLTGEHDDPEIMRNHASGIHLAIRRTDELAIAISQQCVKLEEIKSAISTLIAKMDRIEDLAARVATIERWIEKREEREEERQARMVNAIVQPLGSLVVKAMLFSLLAGLAFFLYQHLGGFLWSSKP